VVDSQGLLIPKLATLKEIQDRVIYIDPTHPPSIDIFKKGATDIFDYLFSSIIGSPLTPRQSVFFQHIAKLMMTVPNASLRDLLEVMEDKEPYQEYIDRLKDTQRNFFNRDFGTKKQSAFKDTREHLAYRLNAIMINDTLYDLFSSSDDTLHLEDALNSGKVVLIDTSTEQLGTASSQYGRIFIWLVLRAIYNRASTQESKRHPTFMIVDEAQEYFDQNIDDMLTQARKYKLGCAFAHQYLGQCNPQLLASLRANTSIKMVGGASASDAKALAPELRTTADFILNQERLHFATYIKNVTDTALSLPVQPGMLDSQEHVKKYKRPRKEHREPLQNIAEPKSPKDIDISASQDW
jgi:hypothetical protein